MYIMKADGVVFYDPSSDDTALHVLFPKVKYELNKSDKLTFTMLPGNVLYDGLVKLKTIVTLEQDGEVIFRGRVLETATDLYNQKEVYCEGELSYLIDSMVRPYKFKGSAKDFLALMVEQHNAQVDEYKHFAVGLTTALTDDDTIDTDSEDWRDTLAEIKDLLVDFFRGYLRIRHEGGIRYLDYVDKFDQPCSQEINFGVNLVDIEQRIDAQSFCTVLIPLGKQKSGKYTTIEDKNDGKDCIEDAEAIARYGRIVKTIHWGDVEDPDALLALGQEHMARMQAETTLTIKAVDLRTVGADVDGIRLGDTVRLRSIPHGLDKEDVCTKIDLDIENPEKSQYTFGLPLEPLTDSFANARRKSSSDMSNMHKWLIETENSFEVAVDALNSKILLKADLILLDGYVKATDFETETLKVLESARIPDLKTHDFGCSGTANIGTLNATQGMVGALAVGTLEGKACSWKGIEVVTGGSVNVTRTLSPYFYDSSNTLTTISYVTDATFVPKTSYITYLGGS